MYAYNMYVAIAVYVSIMCMHVCLLCIQCSYATLGLNKKFSYQDRSVVPQVDITISKNQALQILAIPCIFIVYKYIYNDTALQF